jgi:hypothetical protein
MSEQQMPSAQTEGLKAESIPPIVIGPVEWARIKNYAVFGVLVFMLTTLINKVYDHEGSHELAELRKEVGELRDRFNELAVTHSSVREGLIEQKSSVNQIQRELDRLIIGAAPHPGATSEPPLKSPARYGDGPTPDARESGAFGGDMTRGGIGQARILALVGELIRQQQDFRSSIEARLSRLDQEGKSNAERFEGLAQEVRRNAKKVEGLEIDVNMMANTARRP